MKELHYLPFWRLKELIERGVLSPGDLFSNLKKRIEEVDKKIKGFVRLFIEDIDFDRLPRGPLWGIPIAIKDNICIEGKEVTCCSNILKGHIAPYNATVIEKLKQSGAWIIGITNMDEFAFGSSCETSCFGPTSNPFDLERVPGGSSGGSAAVVASGQVPWALGSDTGGSIRQPAAFCGVVGLKPTYGKVSRYGLVAFGSSLDQIGPLTRDVRDCAFLLNVISGYDPKDSTSLDSPEINMEEYLRKDVKGIKIGLPREYFAEGIEEEVRLKLEEAIRILEKMGAEIIPLNLVHTKYAIPAYYIIAPSEASSNLARFDGVKYGLRSETESLIPMYKKTRKEGFGLEAKRRILLGTYALSSGYYQAYYLRALRVRTLIRRDFQEAFRKVDCLITPTSPTVAFKMGEKIDDPLSMYLSDIFTISANLAGIPGISLPCGFSREGLPIGMQILGPAFREDLVLRVAYSFQEEISLDIRPKI